MTGLGSFCPCLPTLKGLKSASVTTARLIVEEAQDRTVGQPISRLRKSGAVSGYGILSAKDRFRIFRFLFVTTLTWISQWGPSGPTRTVQRSLRQQEDQQQVGGRRRGHEKRVLLQHGAPGSITTLINYKTKSKFRRNDLPTTATCTEAVLFKKKYLP